jgi:hypothetical protein
MPSSLAHAAARNNAEWCDAFCRTHGVDGRFDDTLWSSPVRTPPFYPDAVTLEPGVTVETVLSGIDVSEGCSVKDSYACLDLGSAGLRPLFRAEWVARERGVGTGPGWAPVTTEEGLRAWEAARGEVPGGSGFFRPALLRDEAIMVLGRFEGERVVAGAIVNRSATVVGISNVFDAGGDLESGWDAAARVAAERWRGMTAVGYDRGAGLDAAHAAGFESAGELVVWIR